MTGRTLRPAILLALLAVPVLATAGGVPRIDPLPGSAQPDPGTDPAASRNARATVFAASWRDVGGGRHDPAESATVFLWDRRAGNLRQITSLGPSDQPSVENATYRLTIGAGQVDDTRARTVVAFRSTANPTGGNGDGSAEIFLWDSINSGIAQLTSSTEGDCSFPSVGARFEVEEDSLGRPTGNILLRTRTAFLSTADLAGDNPDGRRELFLHDSGAAPVDRLRQVSFSTSGDAEAPATSRDARRVLFVHDGDVLPGEPAVEGGAVYLFDTRSGLRRVSGDESVSPADAALDRKGRWAAWSAIPSGGGARTIFVADLRRGRIAELPAPGGVSRKPSLVRGGRRVAFLSTAPLSGSGPAVEERPVLLRGRRPLQEFPGAADEGEWSAPRLLQGIPRIAVSTTSDPGDNPSRRTKLYYLRPER